MKSNLNRLILKNATRLGLVAEACFPLVAAYAQSGPVQPAAATPQPAAAAPQTVYLPANALEVLKLVQSGVGDEVVLAYVRNAKAPFSLEAKDILALKDAGVSSSVVAAMLSRDTELRSQPQTQPVSPQPAAAGTYEQKLYAPTTPAPASPAPAIQYAPQTAAAPPAPSAPVAPPAPVVVEQTPPAPQVEVVQVAPGPDYVWTPGYWSWRGHAWVWVGGVWVVPPHPHDVWIGGRWETHGHSSIWIGGRWR